MVTLPSRQLLESYGKPPELRYGESAITDFFLSAPFQAVVDADFLSQYVGKQPRWGPIGYVTYKRTYARPLYPSDLFLPEGIYDPNQPVRTEEFWETLARVTNGLWHIIRCHSARKNIEFSEEIAQRKARKMFERMWAFKWLPPGRGLWMMGSRQVYLKGSASLFNCGARTTEFIDTEGAKPFAWAMDFAMLGTGTGFDVRGAGKLVLTEPASRNQETYVIPDTREGWVESVSLLLDAYLKGRSLPTFDYSLIRPAGSPIRGFGGTASGPEFLAQCHRNLVALLDRRIGNPITSTDIVDIFNEIGACVVSGNVRRSSQISLGYPDDVAFMTLKHHPEDHPACWNSNNSVIASVGMDYRYIADLIATRGEPGLFWLDNVQGYGRLSDPKDYRDKLAMLTNPCVTADTWVQTDQGPQLVADLLGQPFTAIVDGQSYASTQAGFFHTGKKPVYRLRTQRGFELTLTGNHRVLVQDGEATTWREAQDLVPGDQVILHRHLSEPNWSGSGSFEEGWLLGSLLGDGHLGETRVKLQYWGATREPMLEYAVATLHATVGGRSDMRGSGTDAINTRKYDTQSVGSQGLRELASRYGWCHGYKAANEAIEKSSPAFYRGFLRGWFDADGSVQGSQRKGVSVRLASIDLESLKAAQRMLARLGIVATVYAERRPEGASLLPDGRGGERLYHTQPFHELVIGRENLARYAELIGFQEPQKNERLQLALLDYKRKLYRETFTTKVASLTLVGEADVYDCTIPGASRFDANGIVAHNCSEISLNGGTLRVPGGELCNLVETFPVFHDDEEDFLVTLKQAYLFAKGVALVPSHHKATNQIQGKNMRLGVSQSGIQDARGKFGTRRFLQMADRGYKYLHDLDGAYSDWLQVRRSIKLTAVKPSGTLAILTGVSPGIHYHIHRDYLRRVRFARTNRIVAKLRAAGYRCYPAPEQPESTVVVDFPVHHDYVAQTESEVSVWEQAEFAAQVQALWADNQVSVTIKFKPEEAEELTHLLELYETRLKSVSFLPTDAAEAGYEAAPYEAISYERYLLEVAQLKPYDLSEDEQEIEDIDESLECVGGHCPIR